MAVPVQASAGSTAGISGDTRTTSPTDYYYSAPFAVGTGASATAEQTGGVSPLTLGLIVGGVLLVGLVGFVATRPRAPKGKARK